MSKETLQSIQTELIEEVQKKVRAGALNFAYIKYGHSAKTLSLILNGHLTRHFAEVLTRAEVRISELEQGDNPWEIILDEPTATAANVCQQLPTFIWSHYPNAIGTKINVFRNLKAFRSHRPARSIKI